MEFLFLLLVFASSGWASRQPCAENFDRLSWAVRYREAGRAVLEEFEGSYFQRTVTKEQARAWNNAVIRELNRLPISGAARGRKAGLSRREIQELFRKTADHPVASFDVLEKYDPENKIGFCFGRAMTAHMSALMMGLGKENIRKIWAIGSLADPGSPIPWGHHVATAVRSTDGKWYVIDPLHNGPVTLRAWYDELKSTDLKGDMQIFASDPKRFGPGDDQPIRPFTVKYPGNNGYFEDLMRWSREESREIMRQRQEAR